MALLVPNFGGEADDDWIGRFRQPRFQSLAKLWSTLFAPPIEWFDGRRPPSAFASLDYAERPAEPLGDRSVFARLTGLDEQDWVVPWYRSKSVERRIFLGDIGDRGGRRLFGPDGSIVAECHDKSFVADRRYDSLVIDAERLSRSNSDWMTVATWIDELRRRFESSPKVDEFQPDDDERDAFWRRRRFLIKPRFSVGGRGRLIVDLDRPEQLRPPTDWSRFIAAGGAVLEPEYDRVDDFSMNYWITESGLIHRLGPLRQIVTRSGVYLGHQGRFDLETGRFTAGRKVIARFGAGQVERIEKEATATVARAAARGYFGPCGCDGFRYVRDRGEKSRSAEPDSISVQSVVEFNARFTMGIVVMGLLDLATSRNDVRTALGGPRLVDFDFFVDRALAREESPFDSGEAFVELSSAGSSRLRLFDASIADRRADGRSS